jgi:serpin B
MTEPEMSWPEVELERLARTSPSSAHWPSESEIRNRSLKRHRRRLGASGLAAVVLVVAVAVTSFAIVGPGGSHGTPAQAGVHTSNHNGSAVELTSLVEQNRTLNGTAEAKVANAEEEFSLSILSQLMEGHSSGANQLLSPFSLSEALAMAQLGARGQTATQLSDALGLGKLSASEQALGWASLDVDLVDAAAQDHIALSDANSIWTQKGFPIEPDFLTNLKSEFGAGVWQADFASDPVSAIRSVNAWVSQATDGQIPNLLQPSDTPPSTAAVLLNAVLFEAQWVTQLTSVAPGVFHSPGGAVHVSYLSPPGDETAFLSSSGPGLDAVQIPYLSGTGQQLGRRPGRYAALLLMPTSGSLSQFVGKLDASGLNHIISNMTDQTVNLSIPECKIGSTLQLAPALQALGVTDAFGPAANFSGMSKIATQISEVKQQATLSITKWGTVASAATAVISIATAARISVPLTFNRPFLFLVRDTKTGAILFESAINNPTASA